MSQIDYMIMLKQNRCTRIWFLLTRLAVVEINSTTHKCKVIQDLERAHSFCRWILLLSIRANNHHSRSIKSINLCIEGTVDLSHHQIVDKTRKAVSARSKCSIHLCLRLINSQDLKHLQLKTCSLLLSKCLTKVILGLKPVTICLSRTVEAAALKIYHNRILPNSLLNHYCSSRIRHNQPDSTCQDPWSPIVKRILLQPTNYNNSSSLQGMMWT